MNLKRIIVLGHNKPKFTIINKGHKLLEHSLSEVCYSPYSIYCISVLLSFH